MAQPKSPLADKMVKKNSSPATAARSKSLGFVLMSQQRAIMSSSFVDSFRAVLEEVEKEPEEKVPDRDLVGEQMTRLFNQTPEFKRPRGPLHLDYDEEPDSFRPLLSHRNWNRLTNQLSRLQHIPWKRIFNNILPLIHSSYKFLFWNIKPLKGAAILLFGILTVALGLLTTGITLITLWAASISKITLVYFLTILIDLNEFKKSCPESLHIFWANAVGVAQRFDSSVLQGKRYAGREWNREGFAFTGANAAESTSKDQTLWHLPPPSIKEGKRLCLDEEYMARDSGWSKESTKHVVAIDFCYIMLHEEMIRKQASKRRKAMENYGRRASESEVSGLEIIRITRSRDDTEEKRPRSMTRDQTKRPSIITAVSSEDMDDFDDAHDSSKAVRRVSPPSPSEAIEVIRDQQSKFFERRTRSLSDDGSLDIFPGDMGYSGIDDLLEEEFSDSSPTPNRDRHAILTDDSNSLTSVPSESGTDLNWMDVGAEIGFKILGSAHLQRAIASQDTAEKFITIKGKMESQLAAQKANKNLSVVAAVKAESDEKTELLTLPPIKPLSIPVHSMWTSASAAANNSCSSPSFASDTDDNSLSDGFRERRARHLETFLLANNKASLSRSPVALADARRTWRKKSKEGSPRKPPKSRTDLLSPADDRVIVNGESEILPIPVKSSHRSPQHKNTRSSGQRDPESIEVVCPKANETNLYAPKPTYRRQHLLPGVKVAVPIFPIQPGLKPNKKLLDTHFQMTTVVSSKRIHSYSSNKRPSPGKWTTNCLSVTVKLDKSFLRNGEFAEMTFRVMDDWGARYMPKHSKFPLGACVATSFGLGVLVGWRVEDDCHIIRSLWQKRGAGAACAYLRRDSIYSTMEAAVGFDVGTALGRGKVLAYVDGGPELRTGHYFVLIKEEGRYKGNVLELNRSDVLSCNSAQFIPVIEHIREAAQYQLQVDIYEAALRERELRPDSEPVEKAWSSVSKYADILWNSFLRAIEEDSDFDEGMNHFMTSVINFLDRIDRPDTAVEEKARDETYFVITATDSKVNKSVEEKQDPGLWIMNDMFGFFGGSGNDTEKNGDAEPESIEVECATDKVKDKQDGSDGPTSYDRAFSAIRTLMRTVSIARAASVDEPNFKLGLNLCYEFLLFVKTVVKVQKKNVSPQSLAVWKRAWEEIISTFGPLKERLEKIGRGIAERMEKQGRRAKIRLLRFVDNIVKDDALLLALEQGDWDRCAERLEFALVKANIIDEANREHYHKTAKFVFEHFAAASTKGGSAAARNNEKLAQLAAVVQWIASPRRSILKLFLQTGVLDIFERILVRVFHKEEVASRMLSIHASNFITLRHLRILKDITISGALWMPLIDAADAEFSWAVSRMPDNAKDLLSPIANLVSLGVAQFHKIKQGDLTKDLLDFLLEDEAVQIIHDIDMKLILALESFSHDVKETMVVLPYYPSIEDDILNLMDEVDLDEFLKEASDAIDDPDRLSDFIREKSTIAMERFLDYLPKMSIPLEKRDLGDGWVLTCRGENGGDLTLSDVNIKRENLTCQVMGGDTIFFPMLGGEDDTDCKSVASSAVTTIPAREAIVENSILDHIRDLLLNAQQYGCWQEGIGGVGQPPRDRYIATVLHGLPVSSVLNCAIELWRNLEIDDDELLEIAVRDVSYQIQLQQEREAAGISSPRNGNEATKSAPVSPKPSPSLRRNGLIPHGHRFNPRVDPTVLYLEMKKLTLHLEKFRFRIEKHESKRTIFDPVFEGCGSLMVQNVSIKLRIECAKQRIQKMGLEEATPVLQLRELEVELDRVKLKVRETGADWVLNKVVKSFSDSIAQVMATNLKEQVREQIEVALEHVNSYFEVNPDLMPNFLGITMADLEERVVWV